jgi:hypothetical protein
MAYFIIFQLNSNLGYKILSYAYKKHRKLVIVCSESLICKSKCLSWVQLEAWLPFGIGYTFDTNEKERNSITMGET